MRKARDLENNFPIWTEILNEINVGLSTGNEIFDCREAETITDVMGVLLRSQSLLLQLLKRWSRSKF